MSINVFVFYMCDRWKSNTFLIPHVASDWRLTSTWESLCDIDTHRFSFFPTGNIVTAHPFDASDIAHYTFKAWRNVCCKNRFDSCFRAVMRACFHPGNSRVYVSHLYLFIAIVLLSAWFPAGSLRNNIWIDEPTKLQKFIAHTNKEKFNTKLIVFSINRNFQSHFNFVVCNL